MIRLLNVCMKVLADQGMRRMFIDGVRGGGEGFLSLGEHSLEKSFLFFHIDRMSRVSEMVKLSRRLEKPVPALISRRAGEFYSRARGSSISEEDSYWLEPGSSQATGVTRHRKATSPAPFVTRSLAQELLPRWTFRLVK